nr:hypothetical protein [Tanacetum cinerariifolium]
MWKMNSRIERFLNYTCEIWYLACNDEIRRCFLLLGMVEKVVGDVGKWWSWAGMEERGGKTCGEKKGSGRRGEMVELGWNGGERWENVWREKRFECYSVCYFERGRDDTVTSLGT